MADVTIWHNPRCSKSRAALRLLEERGIAPRVRLYLADPPGEEELRHMRDLLGVPAWAMMRRGEAAFRSMGLSAGDPEDRLIAAMAQQPVLIERPIVLVAERAVIARPPEAVLAILPG